MVNSVSGLPAIVIDKFKEPDSQVDISNPENNANSVVNDLLSKPKQNSDTKTEEKNTEDSSQKVSYGELAKKLHSILGDSNLAIQFTVDKDLNKMIMKIIDNDTHEVIQQIPPDITLKIARIVASTLDKGQVTNATV